MSLNARSRFVGIHYPWLTSPTQNLVLIYPRAGTVATSPSPQPQPGGLTVRVGPNPTDGVATVRLDLPVEGPVRVDVVDLLGRVVWHGGEASAPAGEQTLAVDLRGVAAGTYVVRVTAGTHAGSALLVKH